MRAWLRNLPFENIVILEQALLLQGLLLGLLITLIIIFPLGIIFLGSAAFELAFLGALITLLLLTTIALIMLRRGAFIGSAILILAVLLTSQLRSVVNNGLQESAFTYLSFTIPILFAALALGRQAMFATFGIITAAVAVAIYVDRPYESNVQTFVGYLLSMGFFIFIVDRFGLTMRRGLHTAYEQKQQLAIEREQLHVTLTSIGDAVIATDVHGNITFMNAVSVRITGWQIDEAMGQPLGRVFNIINEETRQRVESPYDKVVRTGAIVGLANHTVLIKKDGQEIPIDDSGAPIRDSDGNLAGITLVFRDISERRQSERMETEHRRLVETLLGVTLTVNSTFDLPEVVEYVLETLQPIIPSDFSYVVLFNPINITKTFGHEEQIERFKAAFGALSDPTHQLTRLRVMSETREPLLVPDTRQKPDWLEFPPENPLLSFLGAPIISHNEVIGFIGLHSTSANYFEPDQVRRLQFFATHIAIVIQKTLLEQKEQELAVLEDRQRLARELHDSVTQMLFASSVIAKTVPQMLKDAPEDVLSQLQRLQRLNVGALADMRTLLLELRQTDIGSIPLPELIQQLATATMGNSTIDIDLTTQGDAKLPTDVHAAFYKIAQEALTNVVKHAKAAHVDIQLELQPEHASLIIKDDGSGFDPEQVDPTRMGLKIMQERAETEGAKLEIKSEIGKGTEIHLTWDQS